jgi:hypothetical protein
MSWRDDKTLKVRGHYKGFEIMSRGSAYKDGEPDLFVRGKETYKANLSSSPLGTVASIDAVLRGLDRKAEEEKLEIERQEKALAQYKAQLGRPFEHEARLKELTVQQAQLNAALDLDKHETQTVAEPQDEKAVPASFAARVMAENRAAEMAP